MLGQHIEEGFEENMAHSQRGALENKLKAVPKKHSDAMNEAVRERTIEALKGGPS
jgi:hypothetical protein